MKERSLIALGLAAAICSAILLAFVITQIERSRSNISWAYSGYGLGMFNYSTQNSRNLYRFTDSILSYQAKRNSEDVDKYKSAYLREFDILWSSSNSLPLPPGKNQNAALVQLKNATRKMLDRFDPLMKPSIELTESQIEEIATACRELSKDNTRLANAHYTQYTDISDQVNATISRMKQVALALLVTLFVSIACICFLFFRMYRRMRNQTSQLTVAHQQLTVLVEDLRSEQAEKRAKNQFLASVSHDLRQPLHALGLFLNSLQRNVSGKDGMQILEKIRSSVTALNSLFNSLLDISQLDAGVVEVHKKNVGLADIFLILQEEYVNAADIQNVKLDIRHTDLVVCTDKLLITRILRNLLENAILHAPGSVVTINAHKVSDSTDTKNSLFALSGLLPELQTESDSSDVRRDEYIEIAVSDTGPGVPIAKQEVVFSEYFQLNNPERDRNKGLGLGLSIVKRLSALLEHEIFLTNNPEGGALFTLKLPAGDSASLAPSATNKDRKQGQVHQMKQRCVLVIEDEEDIREGMEEILLDVGCQVHTSESADAAIEQVVERDLVPDIIIADYRLREGKTGNAAIEALRDELNLDIPALLISGDTSATSMNNALSSGLKMIHKPVSPEELLNVVAEILGSSTANSKYQLETEA